LIAVRGPGDVMWLSSTRRATYQAGVWLRRSGQNEGRHWAREDGESGLPLRCDSLGCIYRTGGQVIAFALTGAALDEDCRRASLLIALEPLRWHTCPAPRLVIDRFDLWREGAHAIWIRHNGVSLTTVAQQRGQRPWVLPRPKQRHSDAAD